MSTINQAIAQAALFAVSVLRREEEANFEDLKKRDRVAIAKAFFSDELRNSWDTDGDKDSCYAFLDLGTDTDNQITIYGNCDEMMLSAIGAEPTSMEFELYGEGTASLETDLDCLEYIAQMFGAPMTVINLTPHDVVIVNSDGQEIKRYPATGQTVRVNSEDRELASVDGVSVVRTVYTDVDGLPEPKPNTIYLVSVLVQQALGGKRADVYTPDTGPKSVVRDEKGQIIGVRRLMQV